MGQRILILLCVVFALEMHGQQTPVPKPSFWTVQEATNKQYQLDYASFSAQLLSAHPEALKIDLPLPNGGFATFSATENSNFNAKLSASYPAIKSFRATLEQRKGVEVRLSISHKRLRAIYFWEGKRYLLEAVNAQTATEYHLITVEDLPIPEHFEQFCGMEGDYPIEARETQAENGRGRGFNLRVFELAVSTTGEYAQYHGGTKPDNIAAINEVLLHVNAVFETELAIRLELVPNTERLIFLDPETDPYTEGNKEVMFQESHATASEYLGLSKFDIGHLFNTTFGGLASISSICNYSRKAKGISGLEIPEGYYFDLIVMHELGHQFGAKHTQNSDCNITPNSAFEPGSGSTIMSYAGLCEPNVQSLPDDYFHNESLKTISRIVRSGVTAFCVENIDIDNNEPTVNAGPNYTIPILTPFELEGSGFDSDGDPLLYNWEQFDKELVVHPPRPEYTTGPIFRSYPPTTSPRRMIPAQNFLLNNVEPIWEVLPSVDRLVHFQLSVRDNHEGVGISDYDEMIVLFSEEAGPFLVTQPSNESEFWFIGQEVDIIWDVANTDQEPINCQTVNILLSQDGGLTFPIVLAEEVPNNGVFTLNVPDLPSSNNRIKIEAVDNIFFDISNHDFMIMDLPPPSVTVDVSPASQQACIHFGVLSFELSANPVWGFDSDLTVEVIGQPEGTIIELSKPFLPADGSMVVALLENGQVPIGESSLDLKLSGGETEITLSLPLVFDGPPTTLPTWFTPTSGMEIFSPNVLMNWNVVEEATAFKVELATSPAFGTSTVLSEVVQNEFYLYQGLEKGLVYYWRVTSMNECGEGASTPITAFRSSNLPTVDKDLTVYTNAFPAIAGDVRPITEAYLRSVSNCCEEDDVIYTLLELPQFGRLILDEQELMMGASFTQLDITSGRLNYLSLGEMGTTDAFRFSVRSDRGWILSAQLDIEVVDTQINLIDADRVICGTDPATFTFQIILAEEGLVVEPSVSGLPQGLVGTFSPSTLSTSGEVTLEVNQVAPIASPGDIAFSASFAFSDVAQSFDLDLVVIPGAAAPLLALPESGATINPDEFEMTWQGVGVSSAFIVEIAADNGFNEILHTDTVSTLAYNWDGASPEEIYFWQVTAISTCGNSLASETRLIRTGYEDCRLVVLENIDLSQLAGGNLSFQVSQQENISKVRIPKLRMLHDQTQQLEMSILSPNLTEVLLFDQPDCEGSNLLLRLEDNAPNPNSQLSADCQADFYYSLAGTYKAAEPFSVLRGEPSQGNWQLSFSQSEGALSGTLEEIQVEICSFNKESQAFDLLRNQTLWLYPKQEANINSNFLQADNSEVALEDLVYVITALPAKGTLSLANIPLQIGDEFNQWQVNRDQLTYLPSVTDRNQDQFNFFVKAPKGRLIPEQAFNIEILGGDWYAQSYYHQICEDQTEMDITFFKGPSLTGEDINFTVDGLPSGVTADFEVDLANQSVSMGLAGLGPLSNAFYPLSITIKGSNWQQTTGLLLEKKLGPGFTFLKQPYDGTKISANTVYLEWFEVSRADRYMLEVATRPTFGNTTFITETLKATKYELLNIPSGAIYYWRVTAINDCGVGVAAKSFAFQRMKPFCEVYTNEHAPQSFGAVSDEEAIGQITIDKAWPISRMSVDQMRIYHPIVDQVAGALASPMGTYTQLFEKPIGFTDCGNETLLMGFDDDADLTSSQFVSLCDEPTLFDLNAKVQPIDPFASFAGEIGQGNWELLLANQQIDAGTGLLETWRLEVCFDTLLGAASYRSELLTLALGAEEVVSTSILETNLPGTELRDITYILTSPPAFGDLVLNGIVLQVGSTFNQFDINEGRLKYVHSGDNSLVDNFFFNIHFPDDLWWPNRSVAISLNAPEPIWQVAISGESECLEAGELTLAVTLESEDFGPYSYSLDNEQFQSSPIFSGLDPGEYTVYLQYWDGQVRSQEISALALTAMLTLNSGTLRIEATGGLAPYRYKVDDGPEQESPTFSDLKSGLHEVSITDAASCTIVLSIQVPFAVEEGTIDFPLPPFVPNEGGLPQPYGPPVGPTAKTAEGEWEVYPNPGVGLFYLNWNDIELVTGDKLWIMNSTGQSIQSLRITNPSDHLSLDLRSLPNGVYRLLLQQDGGVTSKQVVIYH